MLAILYIEAYGIHFSIATCHHLTMRHPAALPILIALPLIAVSSCTNSVTPTMPGLRNTLDQRKGVPQSLILAAVKVELADAMKRVADMQKKFDKSPVADLTFKEGNGSLVTTVVSERTNTGELKAVIPFSGYAGSLLTPSIEGGTSATDTRKRTLKFSILPTDGKHAVKKEDIPKLRDVTIDPTLSNSIVAHFEEIRTFPRTEDNKIIQPGLRPREITESFEFVVTQNGGGKIEIKFLPPGHSLDETDPILGSTSKISNTHTLTITLPLDIDKPSDIQAPRTLLYPKIGKNGNMFYVEENFTEKKYNALLAGKDVNPDIPPVAGNAGVFLHGLEAMTEEMNEEESKLLLEALLKGIVPRKVPDSPINPSPEPKAF